MEVLFIQGVLHSNAPLKQTTPIKPCHPWVSPYRSWPTPSNSPDDTGQRNRMIGFVTGSRPFKVKTVRRSYSHHVSHPDDHLYLYLMNRRIHNSDNSSN